MKYEKMFQKEYGIVLSELKNWVLTYINKGGIDVERRYVLAFLVNKTNKDAPAGAQDVVSALESVTYDNVKDILGLSPDDKDIDRYFEIRKSSKDFLNLQRMRTTLGNMQKIFDFIGWEIKDKKRFYLKNDALHAFKTLLEKVPENKNLTDEEKDLQKVLLKILGYEL